VSLDAMRQRCNDLRRDGALTTTMNSGAVRGNNNNARA
jgi:hypothetical protein